MGSTYTPCPVCGVHTRHLLRHIEDEHPEEWRTQVANVCKAFNDLSFNKSSSYADRGLIIGRNDLYKVWRAQFTPAQIRARGIAARRRSCRVGGKKFYAQLEQTGGFDAGLGPGEQRCPVCGRACGRLSAHVYAAAYADGDQEHAAFLDDQVEQALRAFEDLGAEDDVVLGTKFVHDVWRTVLGKRAVNRRANEVNAVNVGKALRGRVLSPEVRAKLSEAHARSPHNGGRRGINGYRHDLGHSAASTYEANVYRILRAHGAVDEVDYKREYHNVFALTYNGRDFHYRVDFQDLKGVFGKPGVYVEVKGFMDDKSAENILAFREKFGEDSLLVIAKRDEVMKYRPDVRVDIDYAELEQRYAKELPLWEDRTRNLRSTPWLYTRPPED